MKKFILIFILIFSLSFLSGCNKQEIKINNNFIMLSISQNVDGSSSQSVSFGVNSEFLRKNTANPQEEFIFKQNLINQVENLRKEFLFSFAITYMANPNEEYKINQGVLLSQVGYNAEGDYVGFEIIFTSSGAWQYYHSSTTDSQDKSENANKKGNIFYFKQKSQGVFPFAASLSDGRSVGEKYANCYLSAAKGLSFESEIFKNYKPDFVYNYASAYSRLNSNSELEFKGNDNLYHHVWVENDLSNSKEIELWTILIYKGWWIFFALIIPLVCMIIAIIVVKFKNKHKRL